DTGRQLESFPLDRAEPGEGEGDVVDAGAQIDDLVEGLVVGHDAAHLFDKGWTGGFDRDTGQHGPGGVSHDPRDPAGGLRPCEHGEEECHEQDDELDSRASIHGLSPSWVSEPWTRTCVPTWQSRERTISACPRGKSIASSQRRHMIAIRRSECGPYIPRPRKVSRTRALVRVQDRRRHVARRPGPDLSSRPQKTRIEMSSQNAHTHLDATPEILGRRKALVLGSIGIASALLERSTAARAAVAEPSVEQTFDTTIAKRISSLAKRVTVNGLEIEYEVIGKGDPVVITPGGRFSKETPGVRELAEALAQGGKQVVIWDRPNCGGSYVSFEGENESAMNADTLAGLLRALDMAPALVVGGSAGSRVSLLTAARHPKVVSNLFILWISGGPIGLASLAVTYCQTLAN